MVEPSAPSKTEDAKPRPKEPAWHRRARAKRSQARTLLRVKRAEKLLDSHHSSQKASIMNDEVKYCPWACSHGCKGSNGKAWLNKGFRTRCQKCEKGPKPGQRKRLDASDDPKGTKGKGKGNGEKSPKGQGKGMEQIVSAVAQLQKSMLEVSKGLNKVAETTSPKESPTSPGEEKQGEDQLEKLASRLKSEQELLKEATSTGDTEAVQWYEGRIEAKKLEIQKLKDERTTPAEQTFNLAGEALNELRATRAKVTKLKKQLKEASEEAENLKKRKEELDLEIGANNAKAQELQVEFDTNTAKLEQMSKAAKGEGKEGSAQPLDIFAVLTNLERLQKCADDQLDGEGASWLKRIFTDLGKFTTALPEFLPQNLPAGDSAANEDMEEDTFEETELQQAKEAGSEAVGKAGPDADKETVRCHAYHLQLACIKKAKKTSVLKGNIKAAGSRG